MGDKKVSSTGSTIFRSPLQMQKEISPPVSCVRLSRRLPALRANYYQSRQKCGGKKRMEKSAWLMRLIFFFLLKFLRRRLLISAPGNYTTTLDGGKCEKTTVFNARRVLKMPKRSRSSFLAAETRENAFTHTYNTKVRSGSAPEYRKGWGGRTPSVCT
jgi:hypothetical protein